MKQLLIMLCCFVSLAFSQNIDSLYTNCYVKIHSSDPKFVKKDDRNLVFFFAGKNSIVNVYVNDILIKEKLDVSSGDYEVKLIYNMKKNFKKTHKITILENITEKCMIFYTDSRYSCYYIAKAHDLEDYIGKPYWSIEYDSCWLEFE